MNKNVVNFGEADLSLPILTDDFGEDDDKVELTEYFIQPVAGRVKEDGDAQPKSKKQHAHVGPHFHITELRLFAPNSVVTSCIVYCLRSDFVSLLNQPCLFSNASAVDYQQNYLTVVIPEQCDFCFSIFGRNAWHGVLLSLLCVCVFKFGNYYWVMSIDFSGASPI